MVKQLIWKNLQLCAINNNRSIKTKYIDLIKGSSGVVKPGEIAAIMGPSGCGKSTLLRALAGFIPPNAITQGTVEYDGKERNSADWFDIVGFVEQDAHFLNDMTVNDILEYSYFFNIKKNQNSVCTKEGSKNKIYPINIEDDTKAFAKKISKSEKRYRIINDLNLNKIKKNLIKRLSGGEKKRLAIGSVLINDPSILLLDEPTSGLDALTSLNTMKILKKFAVDYNKIIILTIHQPSLEIFYMFDQIYLLTAGSVVFQGKVMEVEKFFIGKGFVKRELITLPEHIIEIFSDEKITQNSNRLIDNNTNKACNIDENICIKKNEHFWNLKPNFSDVYYLSRRNLKILWNNKLSIFQFILIRVIIILGLFLALYFNTYITEKKQQTSKDLTNKSDLLEFVKPSIQNKALNRLVCFIFLIGMQFKSTITNFADDISELNHEIKKQLYTVSSLYTYLVLCYTSKEIIIGLISLINFYIIFHDVDTIICCILLATPIIMIINGLFIASIFRKKEIILLVVVIFATLFTVPTTLIHNIVARFSEKSSSNALIPFLPYLTYILAFMPPIYYSALINYLIEVNQSYYHENIDKSTIKSLRYIYGINIPLWFLYCAIFLTTIMVYGGGLAMMSIIYRLDLRLRTEKRHIKSRNNIN